MYKKILYFLTVAIAFSSCSLADNERKMVREGNKAYQDSIFDEAEVLYRKALDYNQTSFAAHYNIANTTYKQENYKAAASKYKRLLDSLETKEWKAAANHNLGNSYLHTKKVDEAIAAYKEALRKNPDDKETKYNLVYAMNLKNQQQQKQNQQKQNQQQKQKQQKGRDEQKQDQQSEQSNKPKDGDKETKPQPKPSEENEDGKEGKNEEQEKGKQNENSDDSKDNQEKESEANQQPKEQNGEQEKPKDEQADEKGEERQVPVGISKEDAENILDAIAVEEKDAQEKVQKDKARKKGRVRKQKNW